MNINGLFDYVKDHVTHFGCFPESYAEFNEEGEETNIFTFPKYMIFFNEEQRKELYKIFDNYEEDKN